MLLPLLKPVGTAVVRTAPPRLDPPSWERGRRRTLFGQSALSGQARRTSPRSQWALSGSLDLARAAWSDLMSGWSQSLRCSFGRRRRALALHSGVLLMDSTLVRFLKVLAAILGICIGSSSGLGHTPPSQSMGPPQTPAPPLDQSLDEGKQIEGPSP